MNFFYRHRVLLFFFMGVILLLLVLVAGCGADVKEPVAEESINEKNEKEKIEVEQEEKETGVEEEGMDELKDVLAHWKNPQSFHALTGSFKELKYQFTGNGTSETIHYTLEGKETVGGIEAIKISLRFIEDASVFTWWVDSEGNVLRLDMDGETMEGEIAAMAGEGLLAIAFMPYYYVDNFQARDVLAGNFPGYSVQLVDQKPEQFGDSHAEVYTLEVTIGPPLAEQESTVRWSVGNFNNFSMLVGWETVDHQATSAFSYQLLELSLVN